MMHMLLLGCQGQVGWELQRSLAPLGRVTAIDRRGLTWGGEGQTQHPTPTLSGDLTDLAGLSHTVRQLRPDVIVNAAAYTAVDKAESDVALARCINAQAPALLAQEAARLGAWLVHYSTDYVFDGGGQGARTEAAPTGPLNVYGQTKLEGEHAITASGCHHLILRTSWVYAARGGNFAKTMLRLAAERELLTVINDQWGAPTGADLIADVTAHALMRRAPALSGIYHLVARGETTWFDYANYVLSLYKSRGLAPELKAKEVRPVPTAAFVTPAQRPLNSRLDVSRLEQAFGLRMPPWELGVERMLREAF
jgi:dTDP-4-dehydrorhamnose reductase